LAGLNKHIEEVVEKEQHVPVTKSTGSNESTPGVIKYVCLFFSKEFKIFYDYQCKALRRNTPFQRRAYISIKNL
jgi:hypothetical protein